ncbi:hypothetical protein KI387_036746, partial [Taxus chinensis]
TPEVKAPSQPISKEESPEEEDKAKSLDLDPPLRKKQRLDEEADSEATESFEKYMAGRGHESEGDGGIEEEETEKDQEPHV